MSGLVLGVGLTQWPYPRDCGLPLGGYLAAIAVLFVVSGRAATVSWMDRRAVVHVLSWMLLIGALTYSAEVALPRVGYARASTNWLCATATEAAAPATLPVADTIRVETVASDSVPGLTDSLAQPATPPDTSER